MGYNEPVSEKEQIEILKKELEDAKHGIEQLRILNKTIVADLEAELEKCKGNLVGVLQREADGRTERDMKIMKLEAGLCEMCHKLFSVAGGLGVCCSCPYHIKPSGDGKGGAKTDTRTSQVVREAPTGASTVPKSPEGKKYGCPKSIIKDNKYFCERDGTRCLTACDWYYGWKETAPETPWGLCPLCGRKVNSRLDHFVSGYPLPDGDGRVESYWQCDKFQETSTDDKYWKACKGCGVGSETCKDMLCYKIRKESDKKMNAQTLRCSKMIVGYQDELDSLKDQLTTAHRCTEKDMEEIKELNKKVGEHDYTINQEHEKMQELLHLNDKLMKEKDFFRTQILKNGGIKPEVIEQLLKLDRDTPAGIIICDCHHWPSIKELHDYTVALEKKVKDQEIEIIDKKEKNALLIREKESIINIVRLNKYKKLFELVVEIDPMSAHGAELKYEKEMKEKK